MTQPPPSDEILDLLTGYALGALAPDEIAQARALLDERPELQAVLAKLRATADKLPFGLPEAEPPADLRQRTLDFATGRATRQSAPAPQRAGGRMRAWLGALGTLAAVALVAAAVGWAQFFRASGEIGRLQGQVAAAETQLDQLQAEVSAAKKVLAALEGAGGQGVVLLTGNGQTVFVAQLPPLQAGRVYQLWRIQGGQPPASAGTFVVDARGFGRYDLGGAPATGETIAVTDEPDGGSPGPTTQPLLVGTTAT